MSKNDAIDKIIQQVPDGTFAAVKVLETVAGMPGRTLRIERGPASPPERPKKKAGKRAHIFTHLQDFLIYLREFAEIGRPLIGVDLRDGTCRACLDERSETETEEIMYRPLPTRIFNEVAAALHAPMKAKRFVGFLRRIREAIVEPSQQTVAGLIGSLALSADIRQFTGTGTKAKFGNVVTVTARSGDATPLELPDTLRLRFLPASDSRALIEVDLSIDLDFDGEKVLVVLDGSLAKAVEDEAESAMAFIVKEKPENAIVVRAQLSRNAWAE